jgi:tetratricopeptide (TPR) repeat protein
MSRHIALLLVVVNSVMAQSNWTALGDSLFGIEKYDAALKAFQSALKENPKDAYATVRAGHSAQAMRQYRNALEYYDRAEQLGYWPMSVMLRKARVHSQLKDHEAAFEWLQKLLQAGFPNRGMLESEKDLDPIRQDRRFSTILAKADSNARPCMFIPEWRQFDFWIGEWDVYTPQGQLAGNNVIQNAEAGCLLIENWTGSLGGTGKSINFYDKEMGKWRQIWVANSGTITEFASSYDDKEQIMKLYGETQPRSGTKILRKLFFYNLAPGKVRQYSEQSTDDGKTWTVAYDFTYILKTSAMDAK